MASKSHDSLTEGKRGPFVQGWVEYLGREALSL